MPRSDVTIFYSTSKPAFAYVNDGVAAAVASAVGANDGSGTVGVEAAIVGAGIAVSAGTIAIPYFLTIPSLSFGIGQTHDMGQYLVDPTDFVGNNTTINGLAGFATYDPVTRLLTGVSAGVETGLTMQEIDP